MRIPVMINYLFFLIAKSEIYYVSLRVLNLNQFSLNKDA